MRGEGQKLSSTSNSPDSLLRKPRLGEKSKAFSPFRLHTKEMYGTLSPASRERVNTHAHRERDGLSGTPAYQSRRGEGMWMKCGIIGVSHGGDSVIRRSRDLQEMQRLASYERQHIPHPVSSCSDPNNPPGKGLICFSKKITSLESPRHGYKGSQQSRSGSNIGRKV